MSLKGFHIVFVSASILLTVGFGVWAVKQYSADGDLLNLVMGIGSFLAAGALAVYGLWFLKKLKGTSYV